MKGYTFAPEKSGFNGAMTFQPWILMMGRMESLADMGVSMGP